MARGARAEKAEVLDLLAEGVEAVRSSFWALGPSGWERTACGDWTATELARHVLSVSTWYHEWLDRAEGGISEPPFPAGSLPMENTAAVAALSDVPGPDAVAAFDESARRYVSRVADCWDLPFGYPFGTVAAGLHAGLAATEWHLHAWDVWTMVDRDYSPEHPDRLFVAAADCVLSNRTGIRGAVLRRTVPLGAVSRPWNRMLRSSGRAPR